MSRPGRPKRVMSEPELHELADFSVTSFREAGDAERARMMHLCSLPFTPLWTARGHRLRRRVQAANMLRRRIEVPRCLQ
jgi:hypothetical protein